MNTNKALLAGAILAMMVLSACEAETGTTTTNTPASTPTTTQGNQQTATTTGTLDVQPGEQPAVTPTTGTSATVTQVATHSEADTAAYNSGQELKDITYCDKIKDEAYKSECKTLLSDTTALSEALDKLDESLCNKLSNDDKKEACKITVQANVQKAEQATEKENEINNQYKLMSAAISAGDLKKCAELTDPNFVSSCEMNILVNKALQSKDKTVCNSGTNAEIISKCIEDAARVLDLKQ